MQPNRRSSSVHFSDSLVQSIDAEQKRVTVRNHQMSLTGSTSICGIRFAAAAPVAITVSPAREKSFVLESHAGLQYLCHSLAEKDLSAGGDRAVC